MSEDELLEELDDGLWLTNTWYSRYQNLRTGDFSTIPRDAILLVRKGEVAGAWKDVRVSENLASLFRRVAAIGSDPVQVTWWAETETPVFTPPVLVRDVALTTSRD